MKKRLLALILAIALCASFSAFAENTSSIPMKPFDYTDWGLSIQAPEAWTYQEGVLPPKADRPFHFSTDTLSSRDTFVIGTWAQSADVLSPIIRLSAFYTSAGTVARIEGVKDKMMSMLVSRTSSAQNRTFQAGEFETMTCGAQEVACFSMTTVEQNVEYVWWNFLIPYKMTVLDLEGFAPVEGELDMKQLLTDITEAMEIAK